MVVQERRMLPEGRWLEADPEKRQVWLYCERCYSDFYDFKSTLEAMSECQNCRRVDVVFVYLTVGLIEPVESN